MIGIECRAHRAEESEHHERDDPQGLQQAAIDLLDGAVHELGGVVDDFAGEALRQLRHDGGKDVAHALDDIEQVRGRGDLDADIDGLLAVEADLGLVVLGAEHHVGDVAQPHQGGLGLLDDQVLEFLDRVQACRGRQTDLDHLALGGADARDVIVAGERLADVGAGQAVGGELVGVEPRP